MASCIVCILSAGLTKRSKDQKAIKLILNDCVLYHWLEHRKAIQGRVFIVPKFKAVIGLAVIRYARASVDDAVRDQYYAAEVHDGPGEGKQFFGRGIMM